jgi:RNA polymerase sigma factor (sigma-70 family)
LSRLFEGGSATGLTDAELLARFVASHDPVAFEALVVQHGPMVLSVCKGFLRDPNDADDAFQATFLILVKKSRSLRNQNALGPWLYNVARRVAIRANAAAARRRACERKAAAMAAARVAPAPIAPDDQVRALHEELSRLPAKLREPVILCDLERLPQERVAADLRLSERTLRRRLNEGRERLKARLIRRGTAPASVMLGVAFASEARAAVSPALIHATVRTAVATVNHSVTAGIVSATAQALTQEVLGTMLLQKITVASTALIGAGLLAWGASAVMLTPTEQRKEKTAASSAPKTRPEHAAKTDAPKPPSKPSSKPPEPPMKITVRGRVLKPDGQPAAGAKIFRTSTIFYRQPHQAREAAISGADGRFEFVADKQVEEIYQNERYYDDDSVVAASAPGYAVAWTVVTPSDAKKELTLQLLPDDIPVTGQIVDLEGKPVPDARIQVINISTGDGENLAPFLEALKAKKADSPDLEHRLLRRTTMTPTASATTDREGRFRLTGVGRDRLVRVRVEGPTIVSQNLKILTRAVDPIVAQEWPAPWRTNTTYYGASFRYAAAPSRPIVGVVRDKDTKKPLAGFTVRSAKIANEPGDDVEGITRTTTDSLGRYRLTGMPKGKGNAIMAVPSTDQPYLVYRMAVPDAAGLEPVTVDLELKRGVWVEGTVTDKVTRTRLRQNVGYFAKPENPHLGDYRSEGVVSSVIATNDDGKYRLAAMPGPGLITIRFSHGYLRARERDDEFASSEVFIPTVPMPFTNYSAIAPINPPIGDQPFKCDVTLDPGMTFKGTVVGPDGQPLAGAVAVGLGSRSRGFDEVLPTAEFTVEGFNPKEPRDLLFQHPKLRMIGIGHPPAKQGESITVKLEPGAVVTGRLVDADGQPVAGDEMSLFRHNEGGLMHPDQLGYFRETIQTDAQGRFRIDALVPGFRYILISKQTTGASGFSRTMLLGDALKSRETRDLGDVRFKE